MALSVLVRNQHRNYLDLTTSIPSTYFEHYPLQHFYDSSQMDYDLCAYNQQQSSICSPDSSYSGGSNNTSNSTTSTSQTIEQNLNSNRSCSSIKYPQPIGSNCEEIISYIDSPPNSKESWTDEKSKLTPGPHIIAVQTIFTQQGLRKRRMDWDALDCGNTASNQAADSCMNNKSPLLKDKQKREKLSGRGSWTDDISFDLSGEFNNTPYLNNESFLSLSPALGVLKQEPQPDQLKIHKCTISAHPPESVIKLDRSSSQQNTHLETKPAEPTGTELCNTLCDSGTSSGVPQRCEDSPAAKKTNTESGCCEVFDLDKCKARCEAFIQQLCDSATGTLDAAHSDDYKFQYILGAATSIATKNNEETLTYLNQGQSYEIKLKKIGDLSFYRDKILKSVIKICFHERRLQFIEREQMQQWQVARPGERIIEVDVPLSYGLCQVSQPLNSNCPNTVEICWDPFKEVGVYIKVNCISTEFTPKKHGGEKGVPFRLQIETYIDSSNTSTSAATSTTVSCTASSPGQTLSTNSNHNGSTPPQPVHAAACQIKVFKLKGADRKHKQDREKILRRPQSEQDKFQPSYECTIMNDIPLDMLMTPAAGYSPEYIKAWPNSPVHIPKYDGALPYAVPTSASTSNSIQISNVAAVSSPTAKSMDTNIVSPARVVTDADDLIINIVPESTPAQVMQWLTNHRLTTYITTFAHFSGADIMRMTKEDFIQICGLADGIRMFNILRAKSITPRLTLYISLDGNSYNAVYLINNTTKELIQKLNRLPGFYEIAGNSVNGMMDNTMHFNNWSGLQSKYSGSGSNIFNEVNKSIIIYISGPSGILVTVTDEVLSNEIKDGSLYAIEVQNGKVILKLISKSD